MVELYRSIQKRKKIASVIENSSGMSYSEIKRNTGFSNGTLSHHIKYMEKNGNVRIRRNKRLLYVFPLNSDPDDDKFIISLRKETCKRILVYLLAKKSARFNEIRDAVKKSQGTVSVTLKQLTNSMLVKKGLGFEKTYELYDPAKTFEILQKLHPTTVDKLKERFEDSFSFY
ncbi:MAG: ArsR family transcriptional regulator [Nitrosopumilales archaeon]|nr:ArsR family transcriptional regulator [Nitrosopumilales archaeon]